MDVDDKKRWVEKALENRPQAYGRLRTELGQCCLDLLMEMGIEDKLLTEPCYDEKRECYTYTDQSGEECSGIPYGWIAEHYGLKDSNPYVKVTAERATELGLMKTVDNSHHGTYRDCYLTLGSLNDTYRISLAEIGRLIEEDPDF